MNKKQFDWGNFYSLYNAKIIENILDKPGITINELCNIFFPRTTFFYSDYFYVKNILLVIINKFSIMLEIRHKLDPLTKYPFFIVLNYFSILLHDFIHSLDQYQNIKENTSKKTILECFKKLENKHVYGKKILEVPQPFSLLENNESQPSITSETSFKPTSAIKILIDNGFLPEEIRRLPRLPDNNVNFIINPTYYPEYIRITCHDSPEIYQNEIVFAQSNYVETIPHLITFDALVKRWGESRVFQSCFRGEIGAYIIVSEDCTKLSIQRHRDIQLYRKFNCGNPFYLKRYYGLERLIINRNESCISLEELQIKRKLSLYFKQRI